MSDETITEVFNARVETEVKKQLSLLSSLPPAKGERVLRVGAQVLIQTVTHYYTGRITLLEDDAIVLDDAAWIPDTGRYSVALATGELAEVEPSPVPIEVARGGMIAVVPWTHDLPRITK